MTAAQLTFTSELVEDYFPFVPAAATGSLVVAVASDRATIPTPGVVVANGSGVVWYRPDPESSSGWTADASPAFAGTVTGLSAFDLDGVLVAVVTIQQSSTTVVQVWYRMPDGMPPPVGPGWVQAPYPNKATSLAAGNVDYVTAAGGFGHGYIVLHTSKGAAFFYLPSLLIMPTVFVLRTWTAVSTAPLTLKPGPGVKGNQSFGGRGSTGFDAVHLVPTYASGQPILWLAMSGPQKFGVCELPADLSQFPSGYWSNYSQVSAGSRSVPVTNPAPQPTAGRSTIVPLLSPQGGITWVTAQPGTGYDVTADTNAPAGVSSLAGCYVSDGASGGQATYVAVGGSPAAVWMTDQPDGVAPGSDWQQMSAAVTTVVAPPVAAERLVFTVATDGTLATLAGDEWESALVGAPGPPMPPPSTGATVLPEAGYLWEVALTDSGNSAAVASPVQLASDRPMLAFVGGQTLRLDSDTTAYLTTDLFGRVTVRSPADSVVAPALRVTAPDFMAAGSYQELRPDGEAHVRLAGITAQDLTSASLIDPSLSQQAGDIASALAGIGAHLASTTSATAAAQALKQRTATAPVYGSLTFGPTADYNPLTAQQWAVIAAQTATTKRDWGSFSSWLKSVGQAAVDLAFSIGDTIVLWANNAIQWTLDTLDDIGAFAELLIIKIGQFVDAAEDRIAKMLRWMRNLFAWQDVANTKAVIYHMVDNTLTNIENTVAYVQARANLPFAAAAAAVQDKMNSFKASFGALTAGYPSSPPAWLSPWGSTPALSTLSADGAADSARQNYLLNQLSCSPNTDAVSAGVNLSSPALSTAITTLLSSQGVVAGTSTLSSVYQAWGEVDLNTQTIGATANFFAEAFSAIIDGIRDLAVAVIQGAQQLVQYLIGLIGKAVAAFRTMIESPLPIPIFTWLTGTPPSMLDVYSWVLALPVTLLYKIMFSGQAPFSAADAAAIVAQPTAWPVLTNEQVDLAAHSPVADPPGYVKAFGVMIVLFGLVQGGFTAGLDYSAALDRAKPSPWGPMGRIGGAAIVLSDLAIFGFSCPAYTLKPGLSPVELAAVWTQWAATSITGLLDLIACTMSFFVTDNPGTGSVEAMFLGGAPIAAGWDLVGPGLVAAAGAVVAGAGIWAAVEMNGEPDPAPEGTTPYGPVDWLPTIIGALGPASKVLLYTVKPGVDPETEAAAIQWSQKMGTLLIMFDLSLVASAAITGYSMNQ